MAYLMASGKWRYESWTDLQQRYREEWKRLDCFQASVDFLSIAILVGSCCFPPNVFFPGKL